MKRALVLLLLLTACKPDIEALNGYVEGDYVYLSSTSAGLLATLAVARGQDVKAGDDLFSLDKTILDSHLASAKAEVDQARSTWNNLTKGLRAEEIEIIFRQQEQANAAFKSAEKEFKRSEMLVKSGGASQSDFDLKKAQFDSAEARVAELEAQLKKAKLGAREDECAAAMAGLQIAEQKVIQAEKRLAESAPKAPAHGRIEDTYYRVGEYVATGAPIVSLLPPENVKIIFFVSQSHVPRFTSGKTITVKCDGCSTPLKAKVVFVASKSEFTPPIIYSEGSRDKLVFRIEAKPLAFSPTLRPGLPVDIVSETP